MAEGTGEFDEAGLRAAGIEGVDDQAGFRRGVEPVRIEADQAETRPGLGKGPGEAAAMILRYVIIVHGPGDVEIAVGVEPFDEAQPQVAEIGFHLEIGVEAEGLGPVRVFRALLQTPSEFLGQACFGKIGDVRRHARHRQPCAGDRTARIIIAAAPVGVGHDRLPTDFVKGNVLGAVPRRGGDDDAAFDAVRIEGGPAQRLHAAHRAANDGMEPVDAQMIEQHRLGADHVRYGDHRKAHRIGIAGDGIHAGRPAGPHATADHIGADDEMKGGIDGFPLPHQPPPPAGLARDGMFRRDILVAGQRVADEDDVGPVRIHPPIGFIGDVHRPQRRAAVQPQRAGQARLSPKAETVVIGKGRAGHIRSG